MYYFSILQIKEIKNNRYINSIGRELNNGTDYYYYFFKLKTVEIFLNTQSKTNINKQTKQTPKSEKNQNTISFSISPETKKKRIEWCRINES